MSGHAKMSPASNHVSATSLRLLIQQIHPHVRVERDSGMCVARDLYERLERTEGHATHSPPDLKTRRSHTHLTTQCGILPPVFRALVFGLALCFGGVLT